MEYQKQTKLASESVRGNCMVACYANYLGLKIEQCPAFEELFACTKPTGFWYDCVLLWWKHYGYTYHYLTKKEDVPTDVGVYFVSGISPRNPAIHYLVMYENGKLIFDPHPDNQGILTELGYEWVTKNR